MNKTVVIVGGNAGALIAREIFLDQYKEVKFLETYSKKIDSKEIISDKMEKGLDYLLQKEVDYFIATGDNHQREKNFELIHKYTKKNPVNCMHRTAFISQSAKIGFGNLVCPNATIHINAKIGNNTIINTGSVVEHDCILEDYAQLSPNAALAGRVILKKRSFVGSGSVVIPEVIIGRDSIIAAGAAVISNIEDNVMYAGVPAKFKKRN